LTTSGLAALSPGLKTTILQLKFISQDTIYAACSDSLVEYKIDFKKGKLNAKTLAQ
jgi:hypothetical protein